MRGIFGSAFSVASISTLAVLSSSALSSSRHPTGDTTKPRSWHSRLLSCSLGDVEDTVVAVVFAEFLVFEMLLLGVEVMVVLTAVVLVVIGDF